MSTSKSWQKKYPCPICKKFGHKAIECWYKKSETVCNYCAGDHLVADCQKLADTYCTRCDRAGHTVDMCRARPCWTCNSIKFHDWRECENRFKNLQRSSAPQPRREFSDHRSRLTHETFTYEDVPYISMDGSCYGVWNPVRQREAVRPVVYDRDAPPVMRFAPRDFYWSGPARQQPFQENYRDGPLNPPPHKRRRVQEYRSFIAPNAQSLGQSPITKNELTRPRKTFRETVKPKVRVLVRNVYSFI